MHRRCTPMHANGPESGMRLHGHKGATVAEEPWRCGGRWPIRVHLRALAFICVESCLPAVRRAAFGRVVTSTLRGSRNSMHQIAGVLSASDPAWRHAPSGNTPCPAEPSAGYHPMPSGAVPSAATRDDRETAPGPDQPSPHRPTRIDPASRKGGRYRPYPSGPRGHARAVWQHPMPSGAAPLGNTPCPAVQSHLQRHETTVTQPWEAASPRRYRPHRPHPDVLAARRIAVPDLMDSEVRRR